MIVHGTNRKIKTKAHGPKFCKNMPPEEAQGVKYVGSRNTTVYQIKMCIAQTRLSENNAVGDLAEMIFVTDVGDMGKEGRQLPVRSRIHAELRFPDGRTSVRPADEPAPSLIICSCNFRVKKTSETLADRRILVTVFQLADNWRILHLDGYWLSHIMRRYLTRTYCFVQTVAAGR